jgi:hypothetical protein
MFLDFAPAYFEYMAKAYYHNLPTVLCKVCVYVCMCMYVCACMHLDSSLV